MTNVRPSIYIGIGGTGINAIAKTKKMFEDAYGEKELANLPVRFVCLDYDISAATSNDNATDISGDFTKTDNNSNPIQLYLTQSKVGKYQWFYPQNLPFLPEKIINGAGQVRGCGRFLTEMILPTINAKLKTAYQDVKNIQKKMAYEHVFKVDCYIAMSIAGGTGCGSFLNVAWALRQLFPNDVNIIGYGVLHSVFRAMDVYGNLTPRVVSNAYSAIVDLDYLMSADPQNPIVVTMNGVTKELQEPLYNQFYVIDNETVNGKVVTNCDSLCEIISNGMFTAAGAIGAKVESDMANVHWTKGHQYNISPKNGWVQSLGVCQIVYDGASLADIYAHKASVELISQLLGKDSDISQEAITWTVIAQIREDGDQYNYLTDRIYSPSQIAKIKAPNVDIRDALTDTKSIVEKYLSVIPEFPDDKQIDEIQNNIIAELKGAVDKMVNSRNGVGNTKQFLDNLRTLCVGYKGEMEHEKQEKENSAAQIDETLKQRGYKEFDEINHRLLRGREAKEEALESCVSKPAQQILKLKAEAKRRACAYSIFVQIISEIDGLLTKVTNLESSLENLQKNLTNELLNKQNAATGVSTFQIDLSATERVNMPFDASVVNLPDFISVLPASLLDDSMTIAKLVEYISLYTRNTKVVLDDQGNERKEELNPAPFAQYNTYRNKLLDKVIAEMSEKDPVTYNQLKEDIDNLASPFLPIDDRGLLNENDKSPSQLLNRLTLICHYAETTEKIENGKTTLVPIPITFQKDNTFSGDQHTSFLSNDLDYFKQRMIIYRSHIAVIPYCIKAFSDNVVDAEYTHTLTLKDKPQPHFDKLLFEEMKKKDFKLKPEIKNEAMFYWVCGGILDFGWKTITESANIMQKDSDGKPTKLDHKEDRECIKYIRFYKGKYMYWDEGGKAIGGDKWVTINTADRKNAFDRFKTEILPSIKTELHSRIVKQISSHGHDFYEQRINELIHDEHGGIRASYDYIDMFAVGNKNSATLYASHTQEAEQYDEEWNYIVNELLNALQNVK